MKILITGGAGFIGSNLAEELINNDYNVTIIDSFHTGSYRNLEDIIHVARVLEARCCDINDLDLSNIDIIFHLGIPSSSPMYKDNKMLVGEAINDTIDIFEFARRNDSVKKIIFASSSSLYNGIKPPATGHREDMNIRVTDYYTEARLTIERIAKLYNTLYGTKSVGLRLFSVYGPHEEAKGKYANIITQFLWDMKKGDSPVIYGDGKQKRDFTYVKDIVKAFMLMIGKDFEYEIYNVGTGVSYSFNDVIVLLNDALHTDIKPAYIEMPMNNYVPHTLADITKIRNMGYRPKYTLEQGIDKLIRESK